MTDKYICLSCGYQHAKYFDQCPRCRVHAMYSKETIGNRLIKEGKWNGHYALSCCHLIPEPCPNCGTEATSTSHGYRTGCGNSECGQFLEFEDTWVWNRIAGEDLDALHICLEAE